MGSFDAARRLSQVKVPLLWIAAAPPEDPARLRELCPQHWLGVTAGAGHYLQLEAPEQVNGMIERFLSRGFSAPS